MLILAREARGFTQKELALKIGIEQGTLSKIELKLLAFPEKYYDLLCNILDFPLSFFFAECNQFRSNAFYYRKKLQTPQKILQQAEAQMNICKMHIETLFRSVELSQVNLPIWDVEEYGSPELCANHLREFWRIPKGKIDDLTKIIEHNGIMVIAIDLPNLKIDALSIFTKHNQPIIFVNKSISADRQRFNIAHELGHLIMHFAKPVGIDRDVEAEAMLFASTFLLPKNEILPHLTQLNLVKLADLKKYWKVSMAAILMRAKKLHTITDNQYQYLWKQMAANGYKLEEPVFFQKEKPFLLKNMIDIHLKELNYSEDELANIFHLHLHEFKRIYFEPNPNSLFRVIKPQN